MYTHQTWLFAVLTLGLLLACTESPRTTNNSAPGAVGQSQPTRDERSAQAEKGSGLLSRDTILVTASGKQLVPELRIDGESAGLVPFRLIHMSSDGSIAIPQQQNNHVRFFDERGKGLATRGRTGGGPGEFRRLETSGMVGDTVWGWDFASKRLTLLLADKGVRTFALPTALLSTQDPGMARTYSQVQPRAVYGDGTVLVAATGHQESTAVHQPGELLRIRTDGKVVGNIGRIPTATGIASYRGARVVPPFYQAPIVAYAQHGSRIAHVVAHVEGTTGMMQLVVLDASGDTVFRKDIPFEPERIPRQVKDSAVSALSARFARMNAQPMLAALRHAVIPDTYSPFHDLVLGIDGSVWLALRRTDVQRWLILDAMGLTVDTLIVRANVRIAGVSAAEVWLAERDEFGVESIIRYRLAPSNAA